MTTQNPFGNAAAAGAMQGQLTGGLTVPTAPNVVPQDVGFSVPADPNWEPLEFGATIDVEGFFAFRIVSDKNSTLPNSNEPGAQFMLEILDSDYAGKKLGKHMVFPTVNQKLMGFWRRLVLSMTNDPAASKSPFTWREGAWTGQLCWGKVGSYWDKQGERKSSVDLFIPKAEYEEAVAKGAHRSPPKQQKPQGLPGGLPGAFGPPMGQPPQPMAMQPLSPQPFTPQTTGQGPVDRIGSAAEPGPLGPQPITSTPMPPVQNGVLPSVTTAPPPPTGPAPKFSFLGRK